MKKRGRPRKNKPLTDILEEELVEQEKGENWKEEELSEESFEEERKTEYVDVGTKERPILTKNGLNLLQKELKELKTIKRQEVADRIRQAREFGDISENSEYEEAKKDQMFIENRIAELEDILKSAIIVEEEETQGDEDLIVHAGTTVKLQNLNDSSVQEYKIVGTLEADPFNNIISNSSPLGRALIGRSKGNIVRINIPAGTFKYKILNIRKS